MRISQQDIIAKCDEQGYSISQSALSKMFSGSAVTMLQAIYCEVTSGKIGEKCYLVFHYDFLTSRDLECRIGAVVTVSSGLKRSPTMHKMLLTKEVLTEEDLCFLSGQLKPNHSEVLIPETAYMEFLRDEHFPDKFFEYFGDKETNAERFISSVAKTPYYTFNESMISDSFLPAMDKIKIICLLRKYSSSPRYNKVSFKSEEIVFDYFDRKRKDAAKPARTKNDK